MIRAKKCKKCGKPRIKACPLCVFHNKELRREKARLERIRLRCPLKDTVTLNGLDVNYEN